MGSDSTFGASKSMQVQEGFGEAAFTWANANLATCSWAADAWFEHLGPVSLSQCLSENQLGGEPESEHRTLFATHLFAQNPPKVIPGLELDLSDLGEPASLEATKLGKQTLETLNSLGVNWHYNNRIPVGNDKYIEHELKNEGVAQWLNFFGIHVMQRFKVYVDTSGRETLVWSAAILVATRRYGHETSRFIDNLQGLQEYSQSSEYLASGGISFGNWSEKFFIPALAKSLFFLAETPFPDTTLMSMSRSLAYNDVPVEKHPKPFISFVRDDYIIAPYAQDHTGTLWDGSFFPTILHAGWLVTQENIDHLSEFLPIFTDGLNRITSTLDDGYLNHRDAHSSSPYDEIVHSACVFDRSYVAGGLTLGRSQWVPTTRVGFLLNETRKRFENGSKLLPDRQARKEFWWCQDEGAGPLVGAAANSLVWYFFMADLDEYPSDIVAAERICLQINRLGIPEDSVNALSNLGILNYMARNYERAIELFDLVLADADSYSDNEANFYLAHIYALLGREARSEHHKRLYEAGPEYEYPIQTQISEDGSKAIPPVSTIASAKRHQFCTECGTKHLDAKTNFCTNCGRIR